MKNTNYISTIVKILETPNLQQSEQNSTIRKAKCRVQFPQLRKKQMVHLTFWGNLASDVSKYYKMNDYVLIEGCVSFHDKENQFFNIKTEKTLEITVLKIYPFLLNTRN